MWRLVAATIVLNLLASVTVLAQDAVELFYGYYDDNENLTVQTPSIHIWKDLGERATVNVKYTYETFNIDAPEGDGADVVTGATTVAGGQGGGFNEVRQEVAGGGTYRFDWATVGVNYFYSTEEDYNSNAFSLALSRSFFQDNFTVSALYARSFDEVDNLNPNPGEEFPRDRDSDTITLSLTQVLTPDMWIGGGYSYSHLSGFLSNPTRKIRIEQNLGPIIAAKIFDEVHPSVRDRNTLFVRMKRHFQTRTAADANLSYYFDNWGVNGYATEFRVSHYLFDDLIVRPRYRFYSQRQADFFRPVVTEVSEFMTADDRLRDFNSHFLGVKFDFGLKRLDTRLRDWRFTLSYDHYFESNAGFSGKTLHANILQTSLRIPF
tara:strand:- start:1648 stop:2778 length:1131 start_codon:yes stop_codon:yes gene_type:complete